MKRFLSLMLTAVLALPAAATALEGGKPPALKVGDAVPDFTFRNGLTGEEMNFTRDIIGRSEAIVVVFFNTGCSACMAEMDEASKAARELGDAKVRVYGVAVDKRGEQSVKAYNEIYQYQVTYLLDPTFSMPPKFGFTYTPACALLDKEGKIVFLKGGYDPVGDVGVLPAEIRKIVQ